ncbi:MAG: TatD family hydrolase, partial [Candidatus Omnitrophica bacterium]|nr:TatD family hydrolase [Candidatus Omnitrophota bacterium]
MGFIDSHVHLQFSDFDADREAVIRRAREAGIEEFVLVGSDLENSRQALRLAETHDHLWAAVGVHPHEAKDVDARALTMIEEYAKHPRAVAIGEVGLDFFHHHSPRETQMKVLPAFLQLQQRVCKPIILHCRDAYDEIILLLREAQKTPYNGVLHCFSSSREV